MTTVASTIAERAIKAGAVNTHYWESGTGDPLILIHGGGAGADAWGNWSPLLATFAGHFRTIAFDMVGFGQSLVTDGDAAFTYSQDARVAHLKAFLDALGLERVAIIGNSMGGATALGLAMSEPARVSKLVLMGSAGLNRAFSPQLQTILNYREPNRSDMARIVGALTHESFAPPSGLVDYRFELTCNPAVMDAYRRTMTWVREHGGLHYNEDDIASVTVPTLVVSGREDAVVPLLESVRFHQLIEESRLYAIPRCGHWAMLEHPEEFGRVALDFLCSEGGTGEYRGA
ncbi:alpha/beta hydrolase [Mycolicibacterium sp. BiH015]|uniref:alpha/beta fold hydrolase n=1 Tax=Mycolicibacterium sp. BiH015 TaxID=3018808 RepID=UPI0022DF8169|nr:alpha/beta hydrolase [Mycolicibacterium sp. BiH015]MDA2893273.1 alpha/beta hydrolase [Mycolicibacterium sp. BiH015]